MDAIVCLVDASHILQHLAEKPTNGSVNAAVRQVAFADRIVLNKLDLVNTTYKQKVIGEIRSINRFAPIIEANSSVVDLKSILNISAFSIEKAFEIEPELMDDEELNAPYVEHKEGHNDTHQHNHSHHNHHHHSNDRKGSHLSGVSSYGFQFEGLVSMERLNHFMTTFLNLRSEDLFRSKGVLDLAGIQDSKFVFQGVHEQIQLGPAARQWEEGEKKINKFVFIGRKLPPRKYLYDMLQACLVVNEGNSPFPTYNPDDEEKYLHDPKHTHDHAHHGHATT
uniref:CobW C-terminal domain-containing protein n=1 Tax=Amorphochlora amoebiformis TaxID=1561963 RepID=A0A7S0DH15_9EUKA